VEQWFYETKVLRNDGPDEGMVVCFGVVCMKTVGEKITQRKRAANGRPFSLCWEEKILPYL
jgi:hypothetical protein